MDSVKPVFKYFEERTPGTLTEVQERSIVWHYGQADDEFGEIQAGDLQTHLEKVLANEPVEVISGSRRVEVRPYGISKGVVVAEVLEELGYDPEEPEENEDEPGRLSEAAVSRQDASSLGNTRAITRCHCCHLLDCLVCWSQDHH